MIVSVAASLSANAQDKAHFGVRAVYDMCTSTKLKHFTGRGSGFYAGAVYYAPFGKLTFFQPGLMLFIDNIAVNGETTNEYNKHRYDCNIRTYGLRMPLDFGLNVCNSIRTEYLHGSALILQLLGEDDLR